MASDIRQKILKKYNVDIDEKNIFKLYKIKTSDISESEIKTIIDNKKGEWEHIISSGTNETQIKKASQNLSNADAYGKILSDSKLRTQLFHYYQDSKTDMKTVSVARNFFSFVATSTKITNEIIDFYFEYYKEERSHKSAISQFLNEKYHLSVTDDVKDELSLKNATKKHRGFVRNSFSKETLLMINECVRYYNEAIQSETVRNKFPHIEDSLFCYLHLDTLTTRREFSNYIDSQKDSIANIRYEFGQDFSPLVDLFNTLDEIIELEEIYDNYDEFYLLIKYDKLTPYMYCMENVNKNVINRLYEIAEELYHFSEISEFLNSYFIPVYSHFNLHISDIKSIVRKSMTKRKTVSENSEFKLKGGSNLLFFLAYWPVLLFYTFQRFLKILVDNVKYFSYFLSALVFAILLMFGPFIYRLDYRLLRDIGKAPWRTAMEKMYRHMDKNLLINNTRSMVMFSILTVLILLILYIGPVIFTQYFLMVSASKIVKTIDTSTIDRTIQSYIVSCQDRISYYVENKQIYKIIFPAVMNIVFLALMVWGYLCH